jgi:hypothetical protein
MARNGSGTYSLVSGNPVTTGSTISSTWANNTLSDIATALTGSIAADGQTPITANLPMSNYKHTGAGSASATGQYLVYGQSSAALADLTLSGALNVTGVVTMVAPSTVLLKDSTSFISDDADATKKLAFQASGITTATTRTWTIGNYSGIPAVPTNEGTANQVLISAGAGAQPTWGAGFTPSASNALAGSIIQTKYTQSQALVVGAGTAIPYDNTVPQITEGDLFLTAPAITPSNASNILRITVVFSGGENTNSSTYMTVALFQDSTANAVAAMVKDMATAASLVPSPLTLIYYMTAGTTSATTFTVRAGLDNANPVAMNGNNSATLMGGKLTSSITVEEIKV